MVNVMAGQIWASMNLKRGVGKTTLTANLCRALCNVKPLKILLIDTDPQCSLTLIFKSEEEVDAIEEDRTFYDILCSQTSDMSKKLAHCTFSVLSTAASRVDVLPSHVQLIRPMIASMVAGVRPGQAFRFDQMGNKFGQLLDAATNMYNLVVLDTNPSGNIATFLAVKHANYIIAPVTSDRFSIRGIALMREVFANEFEWLRKEPWRLIPIINNVRSDRDAARVRDQLKAKAEGSFGEEALIEYVKYSGFLAYNEKKLGFAIDRKVNVMNNGQHKQMAANLQQVAHELAVKTRLLPAASGVAA
jgi:chromosome partitioning protein